MVGSLVAVPLLALGAMQATSVLAHEERTERTEMAAGELTGVLVDNDAGSVEVVGVEGADAVVVHARISEGLRSTGHRVDERDGMVVVRGSCPLFAAEWCSVDYTIEVPVDMYVDVSGVEGVQVSDVAGGVNAHSRASTVELDRVGGDVTASANQGRLEATDLSAERYWKDKGMHDVRLRTPLAATVLDAAILETMVLVAPLGGWMFGAPKVERDGTGSFDGTVSKSGGSRIVVAGIDLLMIEIEEPVAAEGSLSRCSG